MTGLEISVIRKIIEKLKKLQQYDIVNVDEDYNGCAPDLVKDKNGEIILLDDIKKIIRLAENELEEIYMFE